MFDVVYPDPEGKVTCPKCRMRNATSTFRDGNCSTVGCGNKVVIWLIPHQEKQGCSQQGANTPSPQRRVQRSIVR